MTDRQAMQATLDAYFDGLNEERYHEVVALFADGAELIAPGISPRSGADAPSASTSGRRCVPTPSIGTSPRA